MFLNVRLRSRQSDFLHTFSNMIGRTGMVDSFNVSLSASFIRKKLSETLRLSTIPVLPINRFSTGSVILSVGIFLKRVERSKAYAGMLLEMLG